MKALAVAAVLIISMLLTAGTAMAETTSTPPTTSVAPCPSGFLRYGRFCISMQPQADTAPAGVSRQAAASHVTGPSVHVTASAPELAYTGMGNTTMLLLLAGLCLMLVGSLSLRASKS